MSEETRKERTLPEAVKRFMEKEGLSAKSVAEKIGYSRPAVSLYLSGNYGAETAKLDEAMAAYLEEMTGVPMAVLINGRRQLLEHRGFYESDDARCIQRLCQRAREDQALGLIVGKSGYGKTTALRLIGKRDQTVYIECAEIMTVRNLIDTLERELKLCPYGTRSAAERSW